MATLEDAPKKGPRLFRTEDGSPSLYHPELDETYHSRQGAMGESLHVFIERGFHAPALKDRGWDELHPLRILEVGFGTGLNAWLSYLEAKKAGRTVHYEGLEPFPLDEEAVEGFGEQLGSEKEAFQTVHRVPWEEWSSLSDNFQLRKRKCRLEELEGGGTADLIYYDAFGSRAQAEMWEAQALKRALDQAAPGAVFVTYCSKGSLKRALKEEGWKVESLDGALGKREMVRGLENGEE